MENQEAYKKAKERVEAKMGFYIHMAVYVGVNVYLIGINLALHLNTFGSSGRYWDGG